MLKCTSNSECKRQELRYSSLRQIKYGDAIVFLRTMGWTVRLRDFSALSIVQIGYGAHLGICTMCLSPAVKRPRLEAGQSFTFSAEDKNYGVTPPFPILVYGVVLH
jgi:hypothetical protein